ncbi:MAG TPA: LytTR family DNA-binding domain-containing protein [Myxococcaceae bacterium]|nr:LytTR family DNA-binding domain-containing protein [Myxococcaceae bacterium]
MAPLRTVVVEDERLARRKLVMLLSTEPGIQLVGECATAEEAVETIRSERPDLLFLDIQLPTMDGFEVLQLAGLENVGQVVVVTAHDRYALKAFDVAAIDYLLKPFDRTRLRQAIARVEGRGTADLHARLLALAERLGAGSERLRRLVIREGERVRFLDVADVDWFESADNYVKVHLGKAEHLVRTTLQTLESRLEPSRFMRIHRRLIVNAERIREGRLAVSGEYEVLLQDGTVLPVGRRFRDRLLLENLAI